MQYTSAEANKLLKKLNDQYLDLLAQENKAKEFKAANGEDIESVRPDYDYVKTQSAINSIEEEIRSLKHAINVFNATTMIDEFAMTIDQMLVYIPQLTRRKQKLAVMKARLPKERVENDFHGGNIIDYSYANYDLKKVSDDYEEVSDMLVRAQLVLDRINNSIKFEI